MNGLRRWKRQRSRRPFATHPSYPLVNTAHILGVALLIGSVVPLDLRLLGLWGSIPLAPLWAVLTRTAAIGLGLAIIFGTLLFITRATEYAGSNIFIAKMILVLLGTANTWMLRIPTRRKSRPSHQTNGSRQLVYKSLREYRSRRGCRQ